MADHSDLIKEVYLRRGMMNRIGWFTYLRLIFENVPHVTKNTVQRSAFLDELVSFQDNFPLKPIEDYISSTTEVGLSLESIFQLIEEIPAAQITFDHIIDVIANLQKPLHVAYHTPVTSNKISVIEKPRDSINHIPTTYSTNKTNGVRPDTPAFKEKNIDLPLQPSKGSNGMLIDCSFDLLKKPLTDLRTLATLLPKAVDTDKIKGLKLAKQPLEGLKGLPQNLVVLNLAGCGLRSLDRIEGCIALKLLNVCNNQLSEIPQLKVVTELYASKNHLKCVPNCALLKILDISHNPVLEVADSAVKLPSLAVLKITNTPFSSATNYEAILEQLFPSLTALNPHNVFAHSSYRAIAGFCHESAEALKSPVATPPSQNMPRTHNSSNLSQTCQSLNFAITKHTELSPCSMTHKKQMSNVIESVSSKRCCIVNPKSIKESMRTGVGFNNPIAAMMIAPIRPGVRGKTLSRNDKSFPKAERTEDATKTIKLQQPPKRSSSKKCTVKLNNNSCATKCMMRTISGEESKVGWGSYASNHEKRKTLYPSSTKKAKPAFSLTQYHTMDRRNSMEPVIKWADSTKEKPKRIVKLKKFPAGRYTNNNK